MSPFSLPPYSHGSTTTMSLSLTHNFLFSLPGILQILVLPSKHLTRILDAPSLCSRIPKVWLPLGNLILEISCCSFSCSASCSFFLLIYSCSYNPVYISF